MVMSSGCLLRCMALIFTSNVWVDALHHCSTSHLYALDHIAITIHGLRGGYTRLGLLVTVLYTAQGMYGQV